MNGPGSSPRPFSSPSPSAACRLPALPLPRRLRLRAKRSWSCRPLPATTAGASSSPFAPSPGRSTRSSPPTCRRRDVIGRLSGDLIHINRLTQGNRERAGEILEGVGGRTDLHAVAATRPALLGRRRVRRRRCGVHVQGAAGSGVGRAASRPAHRRRQADHRHEGRLAHRARHARRAVRRRRAAVRQHRDPSAPSARDGVHAGDARRRVVVEVAAGVDRRTGPVSREALRRRPGAGARAQPVLLEDGRVQTAAAVHRRARVRLRRQRGRAGDSVPGR